LNILNFLGPQPVLNNLNFIVKHGQARWRKNISQILYQLKVEFTFLCFGIKTSLTKILEYFLNMLAMFRHVIWVDEYIIQIDHDIGIQEIGEKIVHKLLKDHRSIGKTKRYYRPLKWSITCSKGSLPFITIGNVNQMVSMVKIYLCIYLSFTR